MTNKEKAEELIQIYYRIIIRSGIVGGDPKLLAIRCALVQTNSKISHYKQTEFLYKQLKKDKAYVENVKFWEAVCEYLVVQEKLFNQSN